MANATKGNSKSNKDVKANATVKETAVKETNTPEESNAPTNTPKKKSKVGTIILIIFLTLFALVLVAGYMLYRKGKEFVNDVQNKVENVKDEVTEKSASFEEIQEKIRVLTEKATNGEISQEDYQKELNKLQEEASKLQIELGE